MVFRNKAKLYSLLYGVRVKGMKCFGMHFCYHFKVVTVAPLGVRLHPTHTVADHVSRDSRLMAFPDYSAEQTHTATFSCGDPYLMLNIYLQISALENFKAGGGTTQCLIVLSLVE